MTPARIKTLKRQQVRLDGTVDASAIYLHGVTVRGEMRDAFFVTTTYGKSIAVDADHGTMLWEYTPASGACVDGYSWMPPTIRSNRHLRPRLI